MSTLKIIILFLLVTCVGCSDEINHETTTTKSDPSSNIMTKTLLPESELKKKWDIVCKIDGCLTGGQYAGEGKFGGEGCVMTNDSQWEEFFDIPQRDLAAFLIKQIPDTAKTETHTCPFQLSTKGELAIYCLQNIYKTNFYDLSPEYKKIEGEIVNNFGNEQNWIWYIQKSKDRTWNLQRLWWVQFKEN